MSQLSPDNDLMIESAVAAMRERPRGGGVLVAGKFNADLEQTEGGERDEDILIFGGGRTGRYIVALPSTKTLLVPKREDV